MENLQFRPSRSTRGEWRGYFRHEGKYEGVKAMQPMISSNSEPDLQALAWEAEKFRLHSVDPRGNWKLGCVLGHFCI